MKLEGFIQARNCTRGVRRKINKIVIHTTEGHESKGAARATAKWMAGIQAPQASAHVFVDDVEAIGAVYEDDIAWGAPGANQDGFHIELQGRAGQDREGWEDDYSEAVLTRASQVVADISHDYGVPIKKIEHVTRESTGICGHVDVSRAFKKSDHTDPGKNFPWDHFILLCRVAYADRYIPNEP